MMSTPPTQLWGYKHRITMLVLSTPFLFKTWVLGLKLKWFQNSDFTTSCLSSFLPLNNSPWSPISKSHCWVDLWVLTLPLWSEAPRIFKIQEKCQHSVHWETCVSIKLILKLYLLLQWIKWDVWAYYWTQSLYLCLIWGYGNSYNHLGFLSLY